MGGHGGLNILPQKRWNVYNYDNREKVRRDEEAAAKEEHIKRQESRKRDSELRLEQLRQARGLPTRREDPIDEGTSSVSVPQIPPSAVEADSDSRHINLFDGIRIFDPIEVPDGKRKERKGKFSNDSNKNKKVKKEEVRVVGPEDEKYRLGHGLVGKGTKLPWYMEQRPKYETKEEEEEDYDNMGSKKSKVSGKKTLEELRAERLKRENSEKQREKALIRATSSKDRGFSSLR
ncbi:hypothetical protein M569_12745, partial [Genlisea aurea]